MNSYKIVFMGTPEFAVPVLKALMEGMNQVVAIVTQTDRPKGRGRKLMPSPIKVLAEKAGIAVLQPEKAVRYIRQELKKHGSVMEAAHLPPSKRERLDKFWGSIANDMDDAELVMAYSRERIIDEKDTDVEKIVSLSDGSAAFISKGKYLISEEDWESELYKEARRNRSAVESFMFVLKYSYEFGRLRRRGIEAVREELLEKAIVLNFSRMALMRRRKNIPKAG